MAAPLSPLDFALALADCSDRVRLGELLSAGREESRPQSLACDGKPDEAIKLSITQG